MKGIILINAYADFEAILYQPKRLKEEFEKLGAKVEIVKNDFFPCEIKDGKSFSSLSSLDFCVYLDKDEYAIKILENAGVRTFNGYRGIILCDDKMKTYMALSDKGIKMPDTIPAPLCFTEGSKPDADALSKVAEKLGYPLVVKECYGSLGNGVYLIKNAKELYETEERLIGKPHLFQRFVSESFGKDVRVLVVGKKVVGAMKRVSDGDFRSNISSGGKGEPYALDEKTVALAEKIADILSLDYCGIDLLFGKDGFYVCEVNSNAFFKGFEETTGINVAKKYAEYILSEIKRAER